MAWQCVTQYHRKPILLRNINWMAPWKNQTSQYIFFLPITQWCTFSDVLFTGGREALDFSVLKYYSLNINYSVNILTECLHILIDCSQLSKTYYNVLFGCSTQENHSKSQWCGRKPAILTCCSVLPPEIVMHNAYIGGHSENVNLHNLQTICTVWELGSDGHWISTRFFQHLKLAVSRFLSNLTVKI